MAENLIEMLKDAVGDQLGAHGSAFLGESIENTSTAVQAIVPAILGGLLKKGNDQQGAQDMLDYLSTSNIDGSLLDNLAGSFGGGEKTNGLLSMGSGILDFAFGRNSSMLESVVDFISGRSGVKKSTSSTLMKMISPLLMGVIGRQVEDQELDARGLQNLLGSQKEHVHKALPAGLFEKMGLGTLGSIASTVTGPAPAVDRKAEDTITNAVGENEVTEHAAEVRIGGSLFSKILPWLILVAVALALLWFMNG